MSGPAETSLHEPNFDTSDIPPSQTSSSRSLRVCREMRPHPARRELFAATPTAFHPRPSWAPDEIECRVLLKLPYTNPSPTLATALRHTITAERQNRAVVLLKVNVLAAAQTDAQWQHQPYGRRHRTARAWTEEFLNYSILRLVWNGSPHFVQRPGAG